MATKEQLKEIRELVEELTGDRWDSLLRVIHEIAVKCYDKGAYDAQEDLAEAGLSDWLLTVMIGNLKEEEKLALVRYTLKSSGKDWIQDIEDLWKEASISYNKTLPKTTETIKDSWYFEGQRNAYYKILQIVNNTNNEKDTRTAPETECT